MSNEIANKQPTTIDEYISQTIANIDNTIAERKIKVPDGFALANGLQSALLAIQGAKDSSGRPALQVCKKESIQKFLLDVVQNGLYANKNHYYPIVFSDQLVLLTSYLGEIYKLKQNDKNVKNVFAQVIYEKDILRFEIHHGYKVITKHEQEFENIDNTKIRGAYAVVSFYDGTEVAEIMTLDQIKKSWSMGQAKGESKAHKLAPDEMCKKTVIRRIAKVLNAINNDSLMEEQVEEAMNEIDAKQNRGYIDIGGDDAIVSDVDDPSDDWNVVDESGGDDEPKTVEDLEQVALPFDLG